MGPKGVGLLRIMLTVIALWSRYHSPLVRRCNWSSDIDRLQGFRCRGSGPMEVGSLQMMRIIITLWCMCTSPSTLIRSGSKRSALNFGRSYEGLQARFQGFLYRNLGLEEIRPFRNRSRKAFLLVQRRLVYVPFGSHPQLQLEQRYRSWMQPSPGLRLLSSHLWLPLCAHPEPHRLCMSVYSRPQLQMEE
jgi:hypothetical protein